MILLEIHREGFNKKNKKNIESVIMLIPKSGEEGGGASAIMIPPPYVI